MSETFFGILAAAALAWAWGLVRENDRLRFVIARVFCPDPAAHGLADEEPRH